MKKIVLFLCSIFLAITCFSQSIAQPVEPVLLEVTLNKTTSIIFPNSIISVDRGSKSLLAQKAVGVENILQVKAADDTFAETNLTVVTADGKLNTFTVRYSKSPATLTLAINAGALSQKIALSADQVNRSDLGNYARSALRQRGKIIGVGSVKNGLKVQLNGLYVKDDFIYLRIFLQNTSNIKYDIEQLRFFIRDSKVAKRTSSQEVELKPVYIENQQVFIESKNQQTVVFVVPKFTIPDSKHFAIELTEKNGGRNFTLKLTSQRLFQAKKL